MLVTFRCTDWQADAFVAVVIVVLVCGAIQWLVLALAPRLLPVEAFSAVFGVTLACTYSTIPVEAGSASVGVAEAISELFIPLVTWQAVREHLHAAASAHIKTPLDFGVGLGVSTEFSIGLTVEGHAHAIAPELVPVLWSWVSAFKGSVIACCWRGASAFASRLVPLRAILTGLLHAAAATFTVVRRRVPELAFTTVLR